MSLSALGRAEPQVLGDEHLVVIIVRLEIDPQIEATHSDEAQKRL